MKPFVLVLALSLSVVTAQAGDLPSDSWVREKLNLLRVDHPEAEREQARDDLLRAINTAARSNESYLKRAQWLVGSATEVAGLATRLGVSNDARVQARIENDFIAMDRAIFIEALPEDRTALLATVPFNDRTQATAQVLADTLDDGPALIALKNRFHLE